MTMRRVRWIVVAVVVICGVLSPCGGAAAQRVTPHYPAPLPVRGDTGVHDPSMVRAANGVFYVYGTHAGLGALATGDLRHFHRVGSAFPHGVAWAKGYSGDPRELWAPDASFHAGRYWLYYAASSFGSNHSAIGVATSRTGEPGSWHDHGVVYATDSGDDVNAIDPGLTVDAAGRWWLSFGSFWNGIAMIEIDPATGKQAAWNHRRYALARRPAPDAVEGSYVIRHRGFYYLFASYGYCCRGVDSTYHVEVGRSRRVTGPYLDRSGTPLLDDGGTPLLATHGRYIGPGGQTVLRLGKKGLLVYHYYDGDDQGNPKLGLNWLRWDSRGWPHVAR